MSWTAMKTFLAGDPLTVSEMNTYIRDNLLETMTAKVTAAGDIAYGTGAHALARIGLGGVAGGVGNPKTVLKATDTAINTDATLNNDPELVFAVGANEVWALTAVIFYDTPAAADLKGGWFGPTAVSGSQIAFYRALGGVQTVATNALTTSAPSVVAEGAGAGVTSMFPMFWQIYVVNGANAGNITFSWSQNTSDAGTSTVRKGSYIRGFKAA